MLGTSDNFNRTVSNSWGTSSSGITWTGSGSQLSVDGLTGVMTIVTGGNASTVLPVFNADFDLYLDWLFPAVPLGGEMRAAVYFRRTDANNSYALLAQIIYQSVNSPLVDLYLIKTVGGVVTFLSTLAGASAFSPGIPLRIHIRAQGPDLQARIWPSNQAEPTNWQVSAGDTTFANGPLIAVETVSLTGMFYPNPAISKFDNLSITPLSFDAFEIQRQDAVDPTWHTIARVSNAGIFSFRDYEARVGILSSYRMRVVNNYEFENPWSSTLSVLLPGPGISGGCISDGHILVFTTNERQDGTSNLAYSSVWMDQQVTEDFTFPEANFVTLQAMYGKDFFTAFRPDERGGERFSRTVLVQAAAIAPETLADFRSLRDMAWDDVSYICVRDEDGNRWFATVLVPSGQVLRDRRLYLAPVEVIEVTDTPSEVDP